MTIELCAFLHFAAFLLLYLNDVTKKKLIYLYTAHYFTAYAFYH